MNWRLLNLILYNDFTEKLEGNNLKNEHCHNMPSQIDPERKASNEKGQYKFSSPGVGYARFCCRRRIMPNYFFDDLSEKYLH